MSAPPKQRGLPSPEVLELQSKLRITLSFKEACQLISYTLVEPNDFAGQVLAIFASDIDALSELIESESVVSDEIVRLMQGVRVRLELAAKLNDLLGAPLKRAKERNGVASGNVSVGRLGGRKKKRVAKVIEKSEVSR